jgi:hypothetical protein
LIKQVWLTWILIIILFYPTLQAQEKNDTIKNGNKKEKPVLLDPYHRNVIKFNPTPMLLWDMSNITISYERLIKKNQSLSLQAGYLAFPNIVDDTVLNLVAVYDRSRSGINLAFDYRYYPFARNRRPAPDGLYIGGYISYYGLKSTNKFDVLYTTIDQQGSIDANLRVANLGFELGYQFIFWKRFSLDLLMFGPSYSIISTNINIKGGLDPDQIQNIDQELVDKLLSRFPHLGTVFSDDGLQYSGRKTQFGALFRYSLQFGVHF